MPDFEVNDLHSIGMIADVPGYQLPPAAWTRAEGVRLCDVGAQRLPGWSQIFGTPPVDPHFLIGLLDGSGTAWWIYTSLTKAYVFQAGVHTDITRISGDYTASAGADWGGTILAGIPIVNNGSDVPQYWASYGTGQKLQDLLNWPATLRTKQILAFGPFLFALGCTKGGINFPHLVKWSHPSAPGALPVSWDETDLTRDTGEYEIPSDSPGGIVGGLPLRDHLYIYKEGVIWRARYIGGRAVFAFQAFENSVGAIGKHAICISPDGNGHVFVADHDVMFHNGSQVQSIIDERNREELFTTMEQAQRSKVFCFANRRHNEVWVCYPEAGETEVSRAFIWNMRDNVWTTVGGLNFRYAASGSVEEATLPTWAAVTETWDTIVGTWGQLNFDSVLLAAPAQGKIALLDSGSTRLGDALPTRLKRTGLGIIGKGPNGPIVDFKRRKLVTRVWIKGSGQFKVRLGGQENVPGPVVWGDYQDFDASEQEYLDFTTNGRAISVAFMDLDGMDFTVTGYKVELRLLGNF